MAMRQAVVFFAIAILLALSRAAAQNPAAPGSESSEGKKVFTSAGCAKCHDADASKMGPVGILSLPGDGS